MPFQPANPDYAGTSGPLTAHERIGTTPYDPPKFLQPRLKKELAAQDKALRTWDSANLNVENAEIEERTLANDRTTDPAELASKILAAQMTTRILRDRELDELRAFAAARKNLVRATLRLWWSDDTQALRVEKLAGRVEFVEKVRDVADLYAAATAELEEYDDNVAAILLAGYAKTGRKSAAPDYTPAARDAGGVVHEVTAEAVAMPTAFVQRIQRSIVRSSAIDDMIGNESFADHPLPVGPDDLPDETVHRIRLALEPRTFEKWAATDRPNLEQEA